jgi:alanine racemase
MTAGGMTGRPVQWVEIGRSALVHNVAEFRRLIGARRKMLAIVKANAYGHGLLEAARIVREAGADWLGVNSLEEGVALREAGHTSPILILGYVPLDGVAEAVVRDLRLVVYNEETVAKLAEASRKLGRPAYLHFKLETGTNRQGIPPEKITGFISRARRRSGVVVEGISSHFANIEDTTDHRYPRRQLEIYRSAIEALGKRGIRVPLRHMSCTAAVILFPETWFNLVRVGIGLYGLWPSKETYLSCLEKRRNPLSLRPVLSWKARIAQIKKVPKDALVGYGGTYKTTRPTTLAVIPVGYYDGYARSLSNSSYVLVKGRRAALRGRVAMDFLTADVTDIPGVGLEEVVTLIGRDGAEEISADNLATLAGTISYEVLARINPFVPRIVV